MKGHTSNLDLRHFKNFGKKMSFWLDVGGVTPEAQKTSISNFHISGSTIFRQNLQKRPGIPLFALKWFYLCPANEEKETGFGTNQEECQQTFRT